MASSKSVDASLWWDPFNSLLTELENAPMSSDLPPHLCKKLKDNHAWFVDTVSLFKPPNEKSKDALNSQKVIIGSHELNIRPDLKENALRISSYLGLDEVQSYILVDRSLESNNVDFDSIVRDSLHAILLCYYVERQCLLKCTRQILMHALFVGSNFKEDNVVKEEAQKLITDGLESQMICVLENLLSSTHPEQMDVDLFTLWAEETLTEDNLVLEILFLVYYESFCTCTGEKWINLCTIYKGIILGSYNIEKLAISTEALQSTYDAKVQLLLILIESLDIKNLLQMVHDALPFRAGNSIFSLTDIQQIDSLISSFSAFETKEAGPLNLAWAVFLCLITSLPGNERNELMEFDHVGYVRQAFEAASLSRFLEILQSELLTASDGPAAGYRSVLRTFISAFIASYEINLQFEDSTLNLILDILCKIYQGEESLCIQFWDRESFIDGPIRCLLCNLEGEFPFRSLELVRLLSALCEGSWPAECVYNFLDKSVGISSLFEITSEALVDDNAQIVETHIPLHIPGIDGLLIPSKTRGHVLKVIDGNTAIVRWEYQQSGVLVLLLHLSQELYLDSNEEVLLTFDLLSRLVSFNMAVCFSLMDIGNSLHLQATRTNREVEKNFWVVEVICTVIRNLPLNPFGAAVMSRGVNILANLLKCSPSHVSAIALKADIFDIASKSNAFNVCYNGSLSGSWLLSGKLAKMLLIDCEQNDYDFPLAISVLHFTMQLLEAGLENDFLLALIAFTVQYILVNHEYWKYKVKHARWKVTLKALEVIKTCIISIPYYEKLGRVLQDMLLADSSVHSTLFRIVCTTPQALENLYMSRLFDPKEIEGLQVAIASVMNILYLMLSKFSKPIQVGSARLLTMLLITADYAQPFLHGNACFSLDDKQIADIRYSINRILLEQSMWNEDLFLATINVLTAAARYQPAFLVAIFPSKVNVDASVNDPGGVKRLADETSFGTPDLDKSCPIDLLLQYVEKSANFMKSNPRILFNVLDFLKALWQGAGHYIYILESLKRSEKFWKKLCNSVSSFAISDAPSVESLTEIEAQKWAFKHHCRCAALETMALDMFLQKKLLFSEALLKGSSELKERTESAEKAKSVIDVELKGILSSWCEKSVLGSLIRSYTYSQYDNSTFFRAKVAASAITVLVMGKLAGGDSGSLSISLLEKILGICEKLKCQPAFSELAAQYKGRGYSDGKELHTLILSDLYYHLQGELDGRKIGPGPFKELSQFIIASNCFQAYQCKRDSDISINSKDEALFDIARVRADLGLDKWDYSEWKTSKEIVNAMLDWFKYANSMVLLASSRFYALKALITVLTLYEDNSRGNTTGGKIPEQLVSSCVDHICQYFHTAVESLAPVLDASEDVLDFLGAQAELLLHLMRSVWKSLPLSDCVLVLKTAGFGLKVLFDFHSSVSRVNTVIKLLLVLQLLAVEIICQSPHLGGVNDAESVKVAEVSNLSLGLIPTLCTGIATVEHWTLALTTIDLILRCVLTPQTWFPVIRKHLPLQHLTVKLQDKSSLASIPGILKFFLTLAYVRGGAEMLLSVGFFSSLRMLFADLSDDRSSTVIMNKKSPFTLSDGTEKPQKIWGLGLAVVTAMVHSLGDTASCADIVENMIPYFFSEKFYLISFFLNAPELPTNNNDKKRLRAQRTQISLSDLRETEHTLMLMCVLAKHWNLWVKSMKEMDSQLREKCIHLLAFISRGTQWLGDLPRNTAPLFCPPALKEEFDWCKKPSHVNSRNGWFALAPLGCEAMPNLSAVSNATSALLIVGQSTEGTNLASHTVFSDSVALQIYVIAFLLLRFLCLQAEGASERAEELGFVDLAHFPELPMPEILHGLQDQASAIVSEVCETNKSKHIHAATQSVCHLLLQIMEMALYLELCVLQICGIRPVLGRVEGFSKEIKLLFKAMEGHAFLKDSVKSLKQIISLLYPGLLQSEGLL
ncbi:uncharacterized protein LOC120001936 isoform X2 [Tripterygium wilfordii]|uniref:uncharacterized protein LOC120001936 isoform X2 n=1 Tax=Tripterygium wilfordii TaxID=458696 RepID=UPI0018F82CCD|nr:uncharacterized protein LOC120001936 isoform X2 [Tripterygium wilfordii]